MLYHLVPKRLVNSGDSGSKAGRILWLELLINAGRDVPAKTEGIAHSIFNFFVKGLPKREIKFP